MKVSVKNPAMKAVIFQYCGVNKWLKAMVLVQVTAPLVAVLAIVTMPPLMVEANGYVTVIELEGEVVVN